MEGENDIAQLSNNFESALIKENDLPDAVHVPTLSNRIHDTPQEKIAMQQWGHRTKWHLMLM